jgi:hypothetical protein
VAQQTAYMVDQPMAKPQSPAGAGGWYLRRGGVPGANLEVECVPSRGKIRRRLGRERR